MEETSMAVNPIPEGYHTVTPYLIVQEADQLIDFVKQAFGAIETYRGTGSAGGIHAEVRIGDSMVMIGGGGSWSGEPRPATIYLYVNDVDTVYKQTVEAGAISTMEPEDQPYGDRLSGVDDRFGNVWYIATHIKDEPEKAASIS